MKPIVIKLGKSNVLHGLLNTFQILFPTQNWSDLKEKGVGNLGVQIELKPIKRRRSLDQNARYWAIVSALADYSGYTKSEMHDEVLCEHFGYDVVNFRGRERKRPRDGSSRLNTEDFNDLMVVVERWAAEANVIWDRTA